MSMVNRSLMDSIAVKMKGFAGNVMAGITKPTTEQAVNALKKQLGGTFTKEDTAFLEKKAKRMVKKQANTVGYKMGDFLSGGISGSVKEYNNAKAVYETMAKNKNLKPDELLKYQPSVLNSIKKGHTTSTGALDVKKVAGTAATVGIAGRVATGGGLYRDKYGNVNVPGVPFI